MVFYLLKLLSTEQTLAYLMTKHLTLLLFIGLAWGQENPDTLVLRDGSVFSGKYLGIIFGGIKFKTIDNNIVKPTPTVKSIQKLSINGLTIINNGRWVVPKKFVKDYQGNINQQSYDNYNITASSEEHFKERSISKLKTTNENYGRGSIVKANDYQIRFITQPKLFHRGGAYLIDIESIEEITLVPESYGKLLKIISNLSIPGTYCSFILFNFWSESVFKEALVLTMIPVAIRGLLGFTQRKMKTIRMSNWDVTKKKVYLEKLFPKTMM